MIEIHFPIVKKFDNGNVIAFEKPYDDGITEQRVKDPVQLSAGFLYTISGNNGIGKTTFVNILSLVTGFLGKTFSHGDSSLVFGEEDHLDNGELINNRALLRSKALSFIFQDPHLINIYTIKENLQIVNPNLDYDVDLTAIKDKITDLQLDDENKDYVSTKISKFILEADNTPFYLSGGEKQLLSFIRSLIKPSNILFADEPWASMDKHLKALIVSQMYNYLTDGDIFSSIRNRNQRLEPSKLVIVISHPTHSDTIAKNYGELEKDWTKVIPVRIGKDERKGSVIPKLSLYRYKYKQVK